MLNSVQFTFAMVSGLGGGGDCFFYIYCKSLLMIFDDDLTVRCGYRPQREGQLGLMDEICCACLSFLLVFCVFVSFTLVLYRALLFFCFVFGLVVFFSDFRCGPRVYYIADGIKVAFRKTMRDFESAKHLFCYCYVLLSCLFSNPILHSLCVNKDERGCLKRSKRTTCNY